MRDVILNPLKPPPSLVTGNSLDKGNVSEADKRIAVFARKRCRRQLVGGDGGGRTGDYTTFSVTIS